MIVTLLGGRSTRWPWAGELDTTAAWAPAGTPHIKRHPRVRQTPRMTRRARMRPRFGRRRSGDVNASLLTDTGAYGVDKVGVSRAVDMQVVVGEHTLGTFPARDHPSVHHPHRLLHEDAMDIRALLRCDVLICRKRNGNPACRELHADIGMPVPMIIGSDESGRWLCRE